MPGKLNPKQMGRAVAAGGGLLGTAVEAGDTVTLGEGGAVSPVAAVGVGETVATGDGPVVLAGAAVETGEAEAAGNGVSAPLSFDGIAPARAAFCGAQETRPMHRNSRNHATTMTPSAK